MSLDRLAESKRRLSETYALLSGWIDELAQSRQNEATHDRLLIARDYVRSALSWLAEVEDAVRDRE